ncbi:6969_t:CDS:2 [Cetraspora pellucida]|uniref:6969_t:CDS:1 n=1 Tax=Cetraspora pellucida TaxID=1433469 RepID=A0A9N9IHJ0_9GLOM|nr:6969_t:CDS:2 [Cetraspora pellucida]
METENFNNKQGHKNLEQNDINIAPSFAKLGLEEYDKTNKIIQQNVQELCKFWQNGVCACRKSKSKKKPCFEKIGFYRFFIRQEECRNMSHNNLDTWIQGQLALFAYNESLLNKKNSQELNNSAIQNPHIKNNGMTEIIHGNTECTSIRYDRAVIDNELKQELSNYLQNNANLHEFPSPCRNMQNYSIPIILLPIDQTYTSIYEEYVTMIKSNKNKDYKVIAYTTFLQIWKEVAPHIRFMTKASDLCDKCEQLCAKI